MRRTFGPAVLAIACSFFAAASYAVPIQVTLQGTLARDASPSLFGLTDAIVPIQLSFLVESEAATTIAAGTIVETNSGASFASNVHLFTAAAISNFVANIGNAAFGVSDLTNWQLGNANLFYDVLLVGDLVDNGISAAALSLENGGIGQLSMGIVNCFIVCGAYPLGAATDFISASTAEVSGVQVSAQLLTPPVAVPEPGSLALFGLGLAGLIVSRHRRDRRHAPTLKSQ